MSESQRDVPYLRPSSLDEALAARAANPTWTVVAGGTDLLVGAQQRPAPHGMLDVFGLDALSFVRAADDGAVTIGAATPYRQLLASSLIVEQFPLLAAAVREIGAVQIQARGTMAGNVATSSPVGDTLPVLLALDADVELASVRGRRVVPYRSFCTGYRKTLLGADELIVSFRLPRTFAAPNARWAWRKVGTRRAQAISKVMMAATATVASAGTVTDVRIALGAVADRPVRLESVETLVRGATVTPAAIQSVRDAIASAIRPIDDVRSSAEYRLRVAQNLVAAFVASLAPSATGQGASG